MNKRRYKQRRPQGARRASSPTSTEQPEALRRRRFWRLVRVSLAAFLVVGLTVVVIGYLVVKKRINETPEWWQPPMEDAAEMRANAQHVERAVTAAMTDIRPADETWTLTVSEEQANHWLAERLPRWLEHRRIELPQSVHRVLVDFSEEGVTLGVSLEIEGVERILGVTVRPEVSGDALWAVADHFSVGTLRLPADAVMARLPEGVARPRADLPMDAILSGERHVVSPPEMSLGDGRRVLIRKLEFDENGVSATCVTLSPHTD